MQRSPSKMVLMPQSRQRPASVRACFFVVADLDQSAWALQAFFRGACGNVQARAPLVVFFAVIVVDGVVELDFLRRDLLTA